jgi:hypothetical protein
MGRPLFFVVRNELRSQPRFAAKPPACSVGGAATHGSDYFSRHAMRAHANIRAASLIVCEGHHTRNRFCDSLSAFQLNRKRVMNLIDKRRLSNVRAARA